MPVYKDECVFCFDTPSSEHGLDVCLTCYLGTSPDPAHDFSARHFRVSGHSAFVNIKQREKEREIKLDTSEPEVETTYMFKTMKSDLESEFVNAIQAVKSASSYTAASQSNAWQLELVPCEHVAMLDSLAAETPQYTVSKPQKCSDCDLTENLWVCLFCGHIGCGRKNYDGTGGNNHAIDHYELNADPGHHCLAVKLGTITAESIDLFCYMCDDEKADPSYKEHLLRLGIDAVNSVKTEESMLELQLKQNARFAFGAGTAVSGKTGMKNLGNTCYLNAVVQSLFQIPLFSAEFPANNANSEIEEANGAKDMRTQLNKLQDGLHSQRYLEIKPEMFKWLVADGDAEFSSTRQQDAFEYFTRLARLSETMRGGDTFGDLFSFDLERRVECLNCHGVRYINETSSSLTVNYTGPAQLNNSGETSEASGKLTDLITEICNPEQIEVKCPRCHQSACTSQTKFKSFPKILAVCVGRFEIQGYEAVKKESVLTCPNLLDLNEFKSTKNTETEDIIDSETESKPEINPEQVEMLCSMGFDKELVKLCLSEGGLNDEETMSQLIELNDSLQNMLAMGFSQDQSIFALKINKHIEPAVEWLFAGKYEDAKLELGKGKTEKPHGQLNANYALNAVVCHHGPSVHAGHYVAVSDGLVYNDETVSELQNVAEVEKTGYVYFFSIK